SGRVCAPFRRSVPSRSLATNFIMSLLLISKLLISSLLPYLPSVSYRQFQKFFRTIYHRVHPAAFKLLPVAESLQHAYCVHPCGFSRKHICSCVPRIHTLPRKNAESFRRFQRSVGSRFPSDPVTLPDHQVKRIAKQTCDHFHSRLVRFI